MAKSKPNRGRQASRRRVKALALGRGVFAMFRDGRPYKIELRDIPQIERVVGRPMLIALVQALNAADRLGAFAHLYALNEAHVPSPSLAHRRNTNLIAFLVLGTLYEALDAVRRLRAAGVAAVVGTSCVSWRLLEEIRLRWAKDPTLKIVRHAFAHHLGDPRDIARGLDQYRTGRRVSLFETDGEGKIADSIHPIGLDILMRGVALEVQAFDVSLGHAIRDQRVYARAVQVLFGDIMRVHGVRFLEERLDPLDRL
jgi:hypothetical protein